jgi:hypothetical protein
MKRKVKLLKSSNLKNLAMLKLSQNVMVEFALLNNALTENVDHSNNQKVKKTQF